MCANRASNGDINHTTNGDEPDLEVPGASLENTSAPAPRSMFGARLALNLLGLADEADRRPSDKKRDDSRQPTGNEDDVVNADGTDEQSQVDLTKLSMEDLLREVGWFRMFRIKSQKLIKDNWPLLLFDLFCALGLMFLGIFAFDPISWKAWASFAIVILLLTLLMKSTIPTQISMLVAATIMLLLRIITPEGALIGFSNTGVAAVCTLFAVAEGVQRTSLLRAAFRVILGKPKRLLVALVKLTIPVAFVSAFLNNTPVIAMMIPVVKTWSRMAGFSASKLLMPLNNAALLGGTCTLIGTSTNLVVVGLAEDFGLDVEFGIFGITPLGVPNLVIGLLYMWVASYFLLTDRVETITDVMNNPREYTVAVRVDPKSPTVGETLTEAGLRQLHGLYMVELTRDNGECIPAPPPETTIEANDILLFAGVVETVTELYHIPGLVPATAQSEKIKLQRHKRRLVEVVINPSSFLVGMTVKESKFRSKFKAAIIAVHRAGEHVKEKIADIIIRSGDTLLLETGAQFMEFHGKDPNFALVSEVSGSQPPREDKTHMIIVGVLVTAMIAVVTAGVMDLLTMALLVVFLMVFTRCMTWGQAAEAISLPVIMTIALSFGISNGLETSGAAAQLAKFIVSIFEPSEIGVLYGIYIGTALLSAVITNNAAVALMFPIVAAPKTGIIDQQGLSPLAAMYTMMLAASASFATPIGYQTNLMVHGPGGYTFLDWVKFGGPMQIILCIAAVPLAYFIYPA